MGGREGEGERGGGAVVVLIRIGGTTASLPFLMGRMETKLENVKHQNTI